MSAEIFVDLLHPDHSRDKRALYPCMAAAAAAAADERCAFIDVALVAESPLCIYIYIYIVVVDNVALIRPFRCPSQLADSSVRGAYSPPGQSVHRSIPCNPQVIITESCRSGDDVASILCLTWSSGHRELVYIYRRDMFRHV